MKLPPRCRTTLPVTALAVGWLALAPALLGCRARPRSAPPPATTGDAAASDAAACVVGGTTAGAPITVACNQQTPARVAVDGKNVYWTVEAPGAVVMKASLTGTAPQPLAYDPGAAFGLALDDKYVYFTQPAAGRVMRVPISGGPAVALATQVDSPLHLTTDGASLYWTGGKTVGSIMKLALRDGATATTLLTGLGRPRGIAVSGGFVFWTDFADGAVLRASTTEGNADAGTAPTPMRLTYGLKQPADLAVVGGYVYVPDQASRVLRVSVGGGAPEKVADVVGVPFGIACDGVSVYWSTLGDGGIFKAPVTGGPAQMLAGGQADPHFLTLDATTVYWGNWSAGGTVNKIAK